MLRRRYRKFTQLETIFVDAQIYDLSTQESVAGIPSCRRAKRARNSALALASAPRSFSFSDFVKAQKSTCGCGQRRASCGDSFFTIVFSSTENFLHRTRSRSLTTFCQFTNVTLAIKVLETTPGLFLYFPDLLLPAFFA